MSVLSEQVSTVTVCVQKATGDQTAPSPVTVEMEHRVHQTKEPVSVLQDTEAPPAKGVSPKSIPHATELMPHTNH